MNTVQIYPKLWESTHPAYHKAFCGSLGGFVAQYFWVFLCVYELRKHGIGGISCVDCLI